jgi:hypothetical protein
MKHRPDDAYMLSHAARVGPTPTFKVALLRCVDKNHLAFWAASALIDLWGADDIEVQQPCSLHLISQSRKGKM